MDKTESDFYKNSLEFVNQINDVYKSPLTLRLIDKLESDDTPEKKTKRVKAFSSKILKLFKNKNIDDDTIFNQPIMFTNTIDLSYVYKNIEDKNVFHMYVKALYKQSYILSKSLLFVDDNIEPTQNPMIKNLLGQLSATQLKEASSQISPDVIKSELSNMFGDLDPNSMNVITDAINKVTDGINSMDDDSSAFDLLNHVGGSIGEGLSDEAASNIMNGLKNKMTENGIVPDEILKMMS